jgi:hypothetical protein
MLNKIISNPNPHSQIIVPSSYANPDNNEANKEWINAQILVKEM